MITTRSISSLLLLTIFVVSIQQGVSRKCYKCSTENEKSDCWLKPGKNEEEECGASLTTEAPPSTAQPPTAQPPTTQPPTAQPPTTQPPTAQPPTTQPPTAQPPTAQPPTAQPPTTQPPTAQPPTAQPPTAQPPTAQPPITQPPTIPVSVVDVVVKPPVPKNAQVMSLLNDLQQILKNYNSTTSRRKRETSDDWECLKVVTKNGDKKILERKCVKKSEKTCDDKKSDGETPCAVCSDKDLCNSASNLKLQLIPAFLSVFIALFLSSQ